MADRLPAIARLTIEARPGPDSRAHWRGSGSAIVEVQRVSMREWRFEESGRMQPAPGSNNQRRAARPLAFRNTLCWRVEANGIELAHQRFGAAREVGLVRLVVAGRDGNEPDAADLVSALPHHCGADRYEARLHLVADGFDLVWRVRGPAKDEVLVHRYRSR